jgi:hypothetical protein
MRPMLKRVIAAVAVKKAIDIAQERRRPPKRSWIARFGAPTLALAAAGGVAYLGTTGRLSSLVGRAKGLAGRSPEASSTGATVPTQDGPVPAHTG